MNADKKNKKVAGRAAPRPRRPRSFYVAIALFLVTRLYILPVADIRGSSLLQVNVAYTFSWQLAQEQGGGFYSVASEVKKAAGSGGSHDPIEYAVEYPPLAIAWMALPGELLPALSSQGAVLPGLVQRYIQANRIALAIVDLLGFLLLARRGSARQLLFYSAAGLILMHILYDRFDLLVGVILLAALTLLCGRVRYLASFVVLAAAINLKLTPIVLLPVWVLGAMPAAALARCRDKAGLWRLALEAARRSGEMLALTAAMFLPFYWLGGRQTLDFLRYHAHRGLEIESLWASLALIAGRIFGLSTQSALNFGAVHVSSPITPVLMKLVPLAEAGVLATAAGSLVWSAYRRLSSGDTGNAGRATVAQAAPDLIAAYTILFQLLSIVTSSVFSPQYLLWLLPLAPLLDRGGKPVPRFVPGFLAVCLITTAIFPYLWAGQITPAPAGSAAILPPTLLGISLLAIRNLLVLTLAVGLWIWVSRTPVPPGVGGSPPPNRGNHI